MNEKELGIEAFEVLGDAESGGTLLPKVRETVVLGRDGAGGRC